ncbi:acetyltransferase [Cellvibrio sp.]|uniref:acetyltransferase n=1 Tax=Cellvibrio sp. TaxID=1965322 RepID=UPI0039647616
MGRLAVLGASGHGKVVADVAECCGWKTVEFFDDDTSVKNHSIGCWSVVGSINDFILSSTLYDGVVVAIGNNLVRRKICEDLLSKNINLVSLVHPAAVVSRYAQLCAGCVIVAGAVINPYACIGRGCIINTNASVDHDCWLGDYVHISPGVSLAGGAKIGDGTWIGIGACVKQLITIGSFVTVGAGAVVVKDVSDHSTVAGVPARPIR